MCVVAIILARGGSKSIPRKNLRSLAGHPLVAYSIAAARQARLISRVIVSSDDSEIRSVSRAYGAEVPFERPPHLAMDDSRDLVGIRHALRWLAVHEGAVPDMVVHLRPTTPLYPPEAIDTAIQQLRQHREASSLRSVAPAYRTPYKMWHIEDGHLIPVVKHASVHESYNAPRQALPQAFDHTGHIDIMWTRTVLKAHSVTGDRILPFQMDPRYCVDIDEPADLEVCQERLRCGMPFVVPLEKSDVVDNS